MNLIQKKRLKSNLSGMEQSTQQCIEFLLWLRDNAGLTDEEKKGLDDVVSHQHNMHAFLTNLSGRV